MRFCLLLLGLAIYGGTAYGQLSIQKADQLYGTASFYHDKFEGRRTASGAVFRQDSLTAAHKSLPLGTRVLVTNRENTLTVEVIVNDRMSSRSPHIIDLSKNAARQLKIGRQGFAMVSIEVIPTLPQPNNPLLKAPTP
ncbi:MAG: septal ring lytic transglycosylase RlpA family protein [Sphingobacteriaceae bacterium]|nr:septal ring lytic transglycosylase RlpA family protein [Sphingobacteriaceae bacterium]